MLLPCWLDTDTTIAGMGLWISSLFNWAAGSTKEMRILMVGLDAAGGTRPIAPCSSREFSPWAPSLFFFSCRGDVGAAFLMTHWFVAGKTTILYKLKLGEVVTTIPTM
jgi:hypothetical protein